jgi:hypothetical protein
MSYENPYRQSDPPRHLHPAGYGYPQPVQPPDPQWLSEPPRNGLGIASLALALCALVPALVPLTSWLATILGFLAVLFGACGLGRVRAGRATNRAMCWFGLVIGIAATLLGILGMVMFLQAMDKLSTDLEEIGRWRSRFAVRRRDGLGCRPRHRAGHLPQRRPRAAVLLAGAPDRPAHGQDRLR